ncbi:MFS transporter [Shewanella surugensis]|uniref:MFS transporter n=1 Tax=Shewanella surugensis TaxID=212020 RepID=A0ABT0LJD4_9GAMM|nr:MFS transporter [Shewanella surugensis]MCL1127803.1 MFS transporter [Shewanella surugensis]
MLNFGLVVPHRSVLDALLIFAVSLCLVGVYSGLIPYSTSLSEVYQHTFPLSVSDAVMLSVVYLAAYSISLIPAGLLIDRIGVHWSIFISTVLLSSSLVLFAVSSSVFLFLISRVLMGIASSFTFLLAIMVAKLYFHRKYLSMLVGFAELIFSFSLAASPFLTLHVSTLLDWRQQTIMFAIFLILLCLLYFIFRLHKCHPAYLISKRHSKRNQQHAMIQLKFALSNRWFWYVLFVTGIFYIHFSLHVLVYGPIYIQKLYHINYIDSISLNDVAITGYMLSCLTLGVSNSLFSTKKLFFFAVLLSFLVYSCNLFFNEYLLSSFLLSGINYFLLGFLSAYALLIFRLYEELSGHHLNAGISAGLNMFTLLPLCFTFVFNWFFYHDPLDERIFIWVVYAITLLLVSPILWQKEKPMFVAY